MAALWLGVLERVVFLVAGGVMRGYGSMVVLIAVVLGSCGGSSKPAPTTPTTPTTPAPSEPITSKGTKKPPPPRALTCGGKPLKLTFYKASQALAALVTLPDGQHVLVDTGEDPKRAGCGKVCKDAHQHVMDKLAADLGGAPIDLLWITHQHSDHIGGAIDIVQTFDVKHYTDNGRDLTEKQIKATRDALTAKKVPVTIVEPGTAQIAISTTEDVKLSAIVPSTWLTKCKGDRNDCSILLRIDYCDSSVVFTGDAEAEEEAQLEPKSATLIQVGHHGSNTSTSPAFLDKLDPKYAVISAGAMGEGMNKTYCHPFASTIAKLNAKTGGAGSKTINAFDGAVKCNASTDANWSEVPASDHVWATERDGDIVLTTTGDGKFAAELGQ